MFFQVSYAARERFQRTVQTSIRTPKTPSTQSADDGILLSAAELFAGRKGHNTQEIKVFLELSKNLLPAASLRDRRQIANMLASHPDTPEELLELLAQDDDALTAYPVLRHSSLLSVDLLKKIVKAGPETARKAIAGRNALEPVILATLCDYGSTDTIRFLLDRNDLTLNQRHMEQLGRRSDLIADLGQELSSRQALNAESLMSQFLYLPASLRAKSIAAAETMGLIKQAQSPLQAKIPAIDTARLRLHGALLKAANLQKRSRFADCLGQGLSLPSSISHMMLQEDQGEALVIALKALGMSRDNTAAVLIRLLGERLPIQDIRKLLFLHRNLSLAAAEALVGSWTLLGEQPPSDQKKTARHAAQYQDQDRLARDTRSHRSGTGTQSSARTQRSTG